MFRLYAVLGTTRPSAIEDKFNFLLSGAFDSYRLSVFWFGTNSLGLGKREEGQEKMVGIRMFGNFDCGAAEKSQIDTCGSVISSAYETGKRTAGWLGHG